MNIKLPANKGEIQRWNRKLILRTIYENEQISQTDLVRITNLSPGTVSNIIRNLRQEGLIQDIGYKSSRDGRKPLLFRLNPEARYVCCLIFGLGEITVGIVNMAGKIIDRITERVDSEHNVDALVEKAWEIEQNLLIKNRIAIENIIANGAISEGIVNNRDGVVLFAAHFGWRNVPLKAKIEQVSNLKTFVEHSTHAKVLAEQWFGIARGIRNVIGINVDSGIGAGIIQDGHLYHGASCMEGEIGHNVVITNGKLCKCGKRGCLETVVSGPALIERALELKPEFPDTCLPDNLKEIPLRQAVRSIFHACQNGDALATRVTKEAAFYLGSEVARIINYHDPELVFFTGFVFEEDTGIFLKEVEEQCRNFVIAQDIRTLKLLPGKLGKEGILLGGAIPAYYEFFYAMTS